MFKSFIFRHKFKTLALSGTCILPFYQKEIQNLYSDFTYSSAIKAEKRLQRDEPLNIVLKAFLQQVVIQALDDQEVLHTLIEFLEKAVNDPEVKQITIKMLLNSLQDPLVLKRLENLGLDLTMKTLNEKEVQDKVVQVLISTVKDEQVIFEFVELAKETINEPDVNKAIVEFAKQVFTNKQTGDAINEVLKKGFEHVFQDPNTMDMFKVFSYNLINSEVEDSGKNLLNFIVKKVVQRKTKKVKNQVDLFNSNEEVQKDLEEKEKLLESMEGVKEETNNIIETRAQQARKEKSDEDLAIFGDEILENEDLEHRVDKEKSKIPNKSKTL